MELRALDRPLCSSSTLRVGSDVPISPQGGFLAAHRALHLRRSSFFAGFCGLPRAPSAFEVHGWIQSAGRGLGWATAARGTRRFCPLRQSFLLMTVHAVSIWRAMPLSSILFSARATTESRWRSRGGMYASASTVVSGVAL